MRGERQTVPFEQLLTEPVRIAVNVPPKSLLEDFNCKIGAIYKRIVSNLRESRTLAAIRDALLPKLMSGELRTGKVEQETICHA